MSQGSQTRRNVLKATGLASATGLAGCLDSVTGGGGDDGIDEVSVGVTTSLSGPFAVFGQAELDGARLAKEDLEAEFDVSIEIETGNTETDPNTGVERMRRLVNSEGIEVALGGVSSAAALQMGSWASENGLVYFPAGAHSDRITGADCLEYVFRPTCSNSMLANTIGAEMAEGADSWFLMYSDYTWGQTAQEAVTRILEENGKEVVGSTAVPFPHDDYSPYVNEAANSDAEGIGVLIAGLDMRKALSSIIDRGVDDRTLAMHQNEDIVYWGLNKEMAGALDMAGQVWGPAVDGEGDFKQRIADDADTNPYVRHYLGYVSMDQAVRAAHRAGSTDPDEMKAALEGHEVTSKARDIKGGGDMYWRECDHQLVQDAYSVQARSVDAMENSPYKQWFDVEATFAGDDVVRSCSDTGCNL